MIRGKAGRGATPCPDREPAHRADAPPRAAEARIWTTLRGRSPVFVPLVAIALIGFVASLAMRPALAEALRPRGEAVVSGAVFYLWLAAVLSPGLALLKAGVLAALGWALATLFSREVPVRALFSLLLVGQAILALRDVLAVTVVYARGLAGISGLDVLDVSLGLDVFLPDLGPGALAVAASIGPCDLLWAGFLVLGSQRVLGLSRGAALAGSVALWGARVAFAVLRARFLA